MENSDSSNFDDYDPKNPETIAQEKNIIRETREKSVNPSRIRKITIKKKNTKVVEPIDEDEDDISVVPQQNDENVMLEEEDDDLLNDEEDEDEAQFKKIKMSINPATSKIIMDFHQDLDKHNIDEILKLATVVRNSDGIIIDDLHKTTPILTKYERTRIIGVRCRQLENGAIPLLDLSQYEEEKLSDYFIATLELTKRILPFIVRRPLPNGMSEYWNLRDLEVL